MVRIFQPQVLQVGQILMLDEAVSHRLLHVMRMRIGEAVLLFNDLGIEYTASITQINKKNISIKIETEQFSERESTIQITLLQGIARGEKMDFIIQKSTELGVNTIVPLITEYCQVKNTKKQLHWQQIAIHATEQSERCKVPKITVPQALAHYQTNLSSMKFVLSPDADASLHDFILNNQNHFEVLVGPEGGLSPRDLEHSLALGFHPICLGPRILRTETAPIVMLTLLQFLTKNL